MKTIIKTVGLLCVLFVFSVKGNAQWRFGFEGGPGFSSAYEYDSDGYFQNEDKTGRLFGQANFQRQCELVWLSPSFLLHYIQTRRF